MSELAKQKCAPCEGGVPPLQGENLKRLTQQLETEAPGWSLSNAKHLEKTYKFPDFSAALKFVNKIGEVAEREGHHPNITLGWGFVRVLVWTHAINGLSENDFYLAAKIEKELPKS